MQHKYEDGDRKKVKEALGRGVKWEEEKKYDDTREKICHRARR